MEMYIQVSAINSCGQESTPALLNIPASEPPELAQRTVEMDCNTPLNDGRPVKITWMVGPREPGVVYPGEERVNVVLDPGNIACLNGIENIASCAATIKEDGVYRVKITRDRVKITRANEVGERINDSLTFESSPLKDIAEPGQNTIKVNITVQTICRAVDHTLVVCFGQRKMGSDEECDFSGGVSLRKDGVQPGVPHTFTANDSVLSLSSGQQYCYTASLLGDAEDKCSTLSKKNRSNGGVIAATQIIVVPGLLVPVIILACIGGNFQIENYVMSPS